MSNLLETILNLSPEQRSQYLSALWQMDYQKTKYNHLFEIPLTVDASIKLEVLRKKVFPSIAEKEFIDELKKSIYWEEFKPFKVKAN